MTASGLLISWAAACARLATCCSSSAWRRASSIRRRSVMSRVKQRVCTNRPSSQRALDEIRTSWIEPSLARISASPASTVSPRPSPVRISVIGSGRIVGGAGAKVIAEQEAGDLVGAQPQRGEAGAARVDEAEVAIGRPHDRGQLLEQQSEVDLLHHILQWNYTIGPAGREDGKCFSLFRYPGIAAPRRGLVR